MSDGEDDDLTALGRRVDGELDAAAVRVDATLNEIDLLRVELSGKLDAARRDMARLVLMGMWGSMVITAGLCLATILVALLLVD